MPQTRESARNADHTGAFGEDWWSLDASELAQQIGTDSEQGLSAEQVEQNRAAYGSNQELADPGPTSLWHLLWTSVKSPMMVLLLSIAAISFVLGQFLEAGVMVFVVTMYVGIHLLNEARADRTMAELRQMRTPQVDVLRDGEQRDIPLGEVVVGDLLLLQTGSKVAADGRLLSAVGLLVDEAPLTGESAPVRKEPDAEVPSDAPLAERPTAIFAGTTVMDGQGTVLVTAVGRKTELGQVATLTAEAEKGPTPLQKEMSDLARTLAFVALGVSFLVPFLGLLRGFDLQEMILTWLSLTFLMVPGQPPIIIAMALALASLELARKQVVVRHLQGAETLGAVTTLLSDKTGTMTQNRMVLQSLLPGGDEPIEVGEADNRDEARRYFLAEVKQAIPDHTSNPTDLAINRAVQDDGLTQNTWGELVDQLGFSRGKPYRALEYRRGEERRTYLAGRPEHIIERSSRMLTDDGIQEWPEPSRSQLLQRIQDFSQEGMRITAYAYAEKSLQDDEMQELVFIAAAAIHDPIRPEVEGAVKQLADSGIRTIMVTGDIPETAASVAQQAGLDAERVLTGRDLAEYSDHDLEEAVKTTQVFGRTSPEDKLRLVQACKRLDQVVAVTGDGINDAPALRTADIGIAMGQKGTDVAQEAADLVLTDDNLARLPDGVAIGRKAYDNFRKGITYYLSAKAILLSIFVAPLLAGVPFPLAPIQIIFTELLMDLASSTIFVTEEIEPGIMARKPRKTRRFLSWDVARQILRNMAGLTVVILLVYWGSFALGFGVDEARTAAFATWLLGHVILALNLKQTHRPVLEQGLLSNKFAAGWLLGMIALVLAMTFLPPVQTVMQTTRLSGAQWAMVVVGAILASSWMEARKWALRR
jgi:P-type Ca2+ transporter type 2C